MSQSKKYRELADMCRQQAAQSVGAIREQFLDIAKQWDGLADYAADFEENNPDTDSIEKKNRNENSLESRSKATTT